TEGRRPSSASSLATSGPAVVVPAQRVSRSACCAVFAPVPEGCVAKPIRGSGTARCAGPATSLGPLRPLHLLGVLQGATIGPRAARGTQSDLGTPSVRWTPRVGGGDHASLGAVAATTLGLAAARSTSACHLLRGTARGPRGQACGDQPLCWSLWPILPLIIRISASLMLRRAVRATHLCRHDAGAAVAPGEVINAV